jgi:hypothetical protein
MKNPRRLAALIPILALAFSSLSCSMLKEIGQAVTNLSRCKFKLDSVSDFTLSGVALTGKTGISVSDGIKLAGAFARKEFPAAFNLNVAALNPNDGTGGSTKSSATMTSFAWTLIIDNTLTINGDIPSPIVIPGTGQQVILPLRMSLDLVKFFKDKGYDNLINLALALGGANSSPSRITLRAKPTIRTDFGPITYPGEIDIIDREFRGQ